MKKSVFGRKFKRDHNERKALFNNLMSSLILEGRIKTTEQKAKAIKAQVDKLVTMAKKEEAHARRQLSHTLLPNAIEKLVTEITPRFKERHGGYTRLIRVGQRFNDNSSMVIMEWTEMASSISNVKSQISNKKIKETKKEEKKIVKKPAVKKTTKSAVAKTKADKKGKK